MTARKRELRALMRARRKALPADARARAAAIVCDRLAAMPEIRRLLDPREAGRSVCAVYLACRDELDLTEAITALLDRGVTVVSPRWNGETYELAKLKSLKAADLRQGPMGVPEPKDADLVRPADVGVWLVPGLAFTKAGVRLGYGGGWYDRLLAEADASAPKLGVAYGLQVVADLPCEPHDIRLTAVVDGGDRDGTLL